MLKWSFNFMSMKSILLFSYGSSIAKRINMTSVFEKKMQLAMLKTAPDTTSAVQKYQSSVHKEWTCFRWQC